MQKFLNASGERLAYRTAGNPLNPAVVLVHGWTSFMGVWSNTIPLLQDAYYVVAVDLLGHGESAKPHGADYSIAAQARRVLGLADMLGLATFALVGHSMGGAVALMLAGNIAPKRITRLVLVSPVVGGVLSRGARAVHQAYRLGRYIAFSSPMIAAACENPHVANALYGRLWFYDLHCLPREIWRGQAVHAFDVAGITPLWKAGRAILAVDLTPHLPHVTAPALLVMGRQDATLPTSEGERVVAGVKNVTAAWYDACGHFPMFEQPEQYAAALRSFLPLRDEGDDLLNDR